MRQTARLVAAALTGASIFSAGSALAATEVQWWHAMGGALGAKVDEIAKKFNDSQSDFTVMPVYKGNYTEVMTAAIAAFRAKQQPQIVQVFEVGTATMMAAEGAVYPVYQLMAETDTPFDPEIYLPAVKSYYTTTDGKMLSMPFNSSTPVLWYNQDALDKAGIEVPRTWDEMFAAAPKLRDAGYPCAFSFGWQSWVMVENFNAWHDMPIGTLENGFGGLGTELVFNNEKEVALLQRIADAQKDGTFKYGGRRGESLPLFINGECAMWMNSSAYYGDIKKDAKFEFGQAMLPYIPTQGKTVPQNSIIGGATLWVLRGSEPEEYKGVAEFFNFLSSPEVQADWHQATGYVPITTPAYQLSQEQGFYKENPGTDTAIKQLSLNQPTANSKGLRFGNFVQIRDVINEELEALWAGDKTAKEALDAAVARGNELLRRFEKANS